MQQTQDTEITLGTGKLLGIFFSLAILCGVFFTLGYMLGRSSAPSGATTEIVGSVPGGNPANKPAAGNKSGETITQNCPPGSPNCASGSGIAIKIPDAQLQASDPASSQPPSGGDAAASSTNAAPELRNGAGGSFMVQVAAVSKKEDADIRVLLFLQRGHQDVRIFFLLHGPGSGRIKERRCGHPGGRAAEKAIPGFCRQCPRRCPVSRPGGTVY